MFEQAQKNLLGCSFVYAATLLLALFLTSLANPSYGANTQDSEADVAPANAHRFNGGLYFFNRHRTRKSDSDADGVFDDRYLDNLKHLTSVLTLAYSSADAWDGVTLDLAGYLSVDLNNPINSPDHEFAFFPWNHPWSTPNWGMAAENGVSFSTASIKFHGEEWWVKLGYFQPAVPGVLGVNWSFIPGAYEGAELGWKMGDLDLGAVVATRYKAPWFKKPYRTRRDDGTAVDYLWSVGARYRLSEGLSAEAAYGGSEGYLSNAHLKFKYNQTINENPFSISYQLYMMRDSAGTGEANNNFDGTAQAHFIPLSYQYGRYRFRAEATFIKAQGPKGYFAYRPISAYGGANGAYEPWWDNRSDFNADGERSFFLSVSRNFDDFLPGFWAGISYARGTGGKPNSLWAGNDIELKEQAFSLDLGYSIQSGPLKGAALKLHYTRFDNLNDVAVPTWMGNGVQSGGFENAFPDERDIKITFSIPLSL